MTDTDDHSAHKTALKEFLTDWTPLTDSDRQTAFTDAPGTIFIDGDYLSSLSDATLSASLKTDTADEFTLTSSAVRNTDMLRITRTGNAPQPESTIHELVGNDLVGSTVTLTRHNDPEAYTVHARNPATGEWRDVATVGTERNPNKPLPENRFVGAVVTDGGEIEEELGRKVSSKLRYDAVESWTHARYIVVVDQTRREQVPDRVFYEPTDQEYDVWFNAFYTDYRDMGATVRDRVLDPADYLPVNEPYCVICSS